MRTQQERTTRAMNMHLCSCWDCERNWWPILQPSKTIPDGLTIFEVSSASKHKDDYCHFFMDDYRFERLWQTPEKYIGVIKRYAGAIMPDYSTYVDMPYPMQMWNKYRSLALAHYWQSEGIDVIPNIQLGDELTLDWMFEGLPKNSVLCASTVGIANSKRLKAEFANGIEKAIELLNPSALVMYGSVVPFDSGSIDVRWYENTNVERMKENKERKVKSNG